jgi:DegV family protein with EDD domain
MVEGANITLHNTMTLSGAAGWQLEAAVKTLRAGWPIDKILALVQRISDATDTLYTLEDLKYLIHGGRISHIKGLLASVLNIKPVIGVDHEHGKYYERGKARTIKRAIETLVESIAKQHGEGCRLRVQVMHAANFQHVALLREKIASFFDCTWVPLGRVSTALTAHTGRSLVGAAYAPQEIFDGLPA